MLCVNVLDADPTLESMIYAFLQSSEPNLTYKQLRNNMRKAKFKGVYMKRFVRILNRVKNG